MHVQNDSVDAREVHHNTSGIKGVSWHKRDKRWQAMIKVNGKQMHLGNFPDQQAAADAYAAAAAQFHGEFARVA